MDTTQIELSHISKYYKISEKEQGLSGAVKSIFHPRSSIIKAVEDLSFSIQKGEIIGFLGANGAGKSTTIKILSGILHPTQGEVRINGLSPQKHRKALVKNIGVVFGQRSQLFWELRLGESFELIRRIYSVPQDQYNMSLKKLNDVLDFSGFINKPVRQLSLGQRMRGDLAASMLYEPAILFLDEPTIGLDTQTKHAVREFISHINRTKKTTVILTTHDMSDVEALCQRLILLHNGKLLEDGPRDSIISRFSPFRTMTIIIKEPFPAALELPDIKIEVLEERKLRIKFLSDQISATDLLTSLSAHCNVIDMSIREPTMEDVIFELDHMQRMKEVDSLCKH